MARTLLRTALPQAALFLSVATKSVVERGHPHSVSASGRAAPSAAVVLGPVVKESPTVLIGTLLYTGKISTAEQSSRGLSDRNKKLLWFIQIQFEPPFKTVWGLKHLRDSRRPPNQTVNDPNTCGRNRPSRHNRLSHHAHILTTRGDSCRSQRAIRAAGGAKKDTPDDSETR